MRLMQLRAVFCRSSDSMQQDASGYLCAQDEDAGLMEGFSKGCAALRFVLAS